MNQICQNESDVIVKLSIRSTSKKAHRSYGAILNYARSKSKRRQIRDMNMSVRQEIR